VRKQGEKRGDRKWEDRKLKKRRGKCKVIKIIIISLP
jgi:hypothetical protein